mmetsp:Transcript_16843/g.63884  ORF Transcript_16843/g.63884 Transcript_16843/m.63884 type:complete len:274 (-) Transcript_16843:483-1304(-)
MALDADGRLGRLAERVHAHGQGRLGGENAGDLSLVLGEGLADEGGVVDEAVLGRVMLGLEGAEEGLLCAEDLHGGGRLLGEVEEGAGVGDEAGANELADHHAQVRCDGGHAVLEVLPEGGAVLHEGDDLVAELLHTVDVVLGDVSAHGHNGSLLEGRLDLGLEDVREVHGGGVGAHAHLLHHASVLQVVRDDLAHLGEVPAVPLTHAHGVRVDLLVQVVEEAHSLHDHGVHLVRAELELVARERVAEAEAHGLQLLLAELLDEAGELRADAAE